MSLSETEVFDGLMEIMEEVAGVDREEVTKATSFIDDLDIDSLSMVEIAVLAEDRFGVKISDDDITSVKTVGDAVTGIVRLAG